MIPREVDSFEVVEMIMLIEEIFAAEIPGYDADGLGSPREIVSSNTALSIGNVASLVDSDRL